MTRLLDRLMIRLFTRRCRGCASPEFHTDHLTPLGRKRYTGRWAR